MKKDQVVTINKDFQTTKGKFTAGERYAVWMEGNEKANIMLVKATKNGKMLSVMNMKNVRAISIKSMSQALEKEFVSIK